MKRAAFALAILVTAGAAFAQSSPSWVHIPHKWSVSEMQNAQNSGVASQANVSLTPTQQEMLKLPGNHLCGNAVTNVSCDELKRAQQNNYYQDKTADASALPAVATWTPPRYANDDISAWTQFADSARGEAWFAFVRTRNPHVAGIVVKTAYKGLSGDFTEMDVLNGQVLCWSAGTAPDYVRAVDVETFQNVVGRLVPVGNTGFVPSVALTPGTNLAMIVQKVCKMTANMPKPAPPLPAAGKCFTPRPTYPIQAMRLGQKGVVTVGFNITADGHTSDLSVESSSGFPSLDSAALAAVSRSICNEPMGTHAALPITFSLSGSMH